MQGLEGATPEQITDKTNCPRASWDVARTTIRKSVPLRDRARLCESAWTKRGEAGWT